MFGKPKVEHLAQELRCSLPKSSKTDVISLSEPAVNFASKELTVCAETESCEKLLNLMLQRFRRIPVVSRNGFFKGIVTTTDMLNLLGAGPRHGQIKSLKATAGKVATTDVITLDSEATLGKALDSFKHYGKGCFPMLNKTKRLVGLLTEWDIAKLIEGHSTGIQVRQIMQKPLIAKEEWPVFDVAQIMVGSRVRRLPVVKHGIITGIVTPTDILKHIMANGGKIKADAQIRSIMIKDIVPVGPRTDIGEAVALMADYQLGGLPVVSEDHELLGIITEKDIVDVM